MKSPNNPLFKDKLFLLQRSVTSDCSYYDHPPSPFTQFVSKLLGLKKTERSTRPFVQHTKSHSTISITKSSTLTQYNEPSKTKTRARDILSTFVLKSDFDLPALILDGIDPVTFPVLNKTMAETIRPFIPKRFRVALSWKLLYSLDQHGASLQTLYSLTRYHMGSCILIIKDADEQVYGAYLSHTLTCENNAYYGTGECFLWKQGKTIPKIHPWTGKNYYMILCQINHLAIGGGDGQFGLWLKSDMETGYSTPCPTFDNECLSLNPQFRCLGIEVWGILQ